MNGRYLLDTNIVIAVFANDERVGQALNEASELYVPVVVLGELDYGARKSSKVQQNLSRIQEFADTATVLGISKATAHRYGQVKDRLRIQGTPIPENDIWIAAIAQQYELSLATYDEHFDLVDGLQVVRW